MWIGLSIDPTVLACLRTRLFLKLMTPSIAAAENITALVQPVWPEELLGGAT